MSLGQLDHWLNTPFGPPELRLYPAVAKLLGRWARETTGAGSLPEPGRPGWPRPSTPPRRGLATLLEREAVGGQAGTTSLIRNYLGFPGGISGKELGARANEQAQMFGAELAYGDGTAGDGDPAPAWPLARPPLLLETSLPGVFAAGDVRHGSVKRVASAVGEGAIAVQLIHQYLAEPVPAAAREG